MQRWARLLVATLGAVSAQAGVDLDWRVETGDTYVGDTARIALYAVADNGGADEPFSACEVIVVWDPLVLSLQGIDNNGPYAWLFSGFPPDSEGLNDTFDDGDASYQGWSNFNEDAVATPDGLLLTTFLFQGLSPAELTDVTIIATLAGAQTAVYDEETPGVNIVDDLDTASIPVLADGLIGDLNCDGMLNAFDIDPFVLALTGPDEYALAYPTCDINLADIDGDGAINAFDIDPFVALLTGG